MILAIGEVFEWIISLIFRGKKTCTLNLEGRRNPSSNSDGI